MSASQRPQRIWMARQHSLAEIDSILSYPHFSEELGDNEGLLAVAYPVLGNIYYLAVEHEVRWNGTLRLRCINCALRHAVDDAGGHWQSPQSLLHHLRLHVTEGHQLHPLFWREVLAAIGVDTAASISANPAQQPQP